MNNSSIRKYTCAGIIVVGTLGIQNLVGLHAYHEAKGEFQDQIKAVESEMVSKYDQLIPHFEKQYEERFVEMMKEIELLQKEQADLEKDLSSMKAKQVKASQVKATRSESKKTVLGKYRISFYDTTHNSQEGWGYQTASGVSLKGKNINDRLIACPPEIPLGTKLYLEFKDSPELTGTYTCVDRGGAIKGNKIDVFYEDNNMKGSVMDMGIKYATVSIVK